MPRANIDDMSVENLDVNQHFTTNQRSPLHLSRYLARLLHRCVYSTLLLPSCCNTCYNALVHVLKSGQPQDLNLQIERKNTQQPEKYHMLSSKIRSPLSPHATQPRTQLILLSHGVGFCLFSLYFFLLYLLLLFL